MQIRSANDASICLNLSRGLTWASWPNTIPCARVIYLGLSAQICSLKLTILWAVRWGLLLSGYKVQTR